ncbi:MAG: hypothetical protein COA79_11190 [Planctomycetota bacterium]|nr:MAG: hypothetical protein COA79_11190 [Planctomycetota bacterium]
MKALILSDLHSNIKALEAILHEETDCDVIYCAGDFVDVGPCPNEIIEFSIKNKIKAVLGNHDQKIIDYYFNEMNSNSIIPEERLWYQHNASIIDKSNLDYLNQLPNTLTFELDGILYGMIHMYINYDVILGPFAYQKFINDNFEGNSKIERLIFGHTHRQGVCYVDGKKMWLNPGSIAYRTYLEPDDKSRMAEYMTISNGDIEFKKCNYDYESAAKDIINCVGQVSIKDIQRSYERIITEDNFDQKMLSVKTN